MDKRDSFDYYYGCEADQFSFFRIPKRLFIDKRFKSLSTDAKVLYGMMLDRMSLSRRNNWIDEQNRVYIIYTLSDIMEDLDCGKDKGVHLIAELDERGIGLIERRKQGFGKPAIIYVKNFISCSRQSEDTDLLPDEFCQKSDETIENSGFHQTSEKPKSRGAECRSQDFGKTEVTRSEKPKSRLRKNRSHEVGKTEVNNTYNNKTDICINPPPLTPPPEKSVFESREEKYKTDGQMYEYIKQMIEYDRCIMEVKTENEQKQVKFLLDLICDVIMHPRTQIRIGGIAMSYVDVRKRFLTLTAAQVLCVVRSMQKIAGIENPSAYALTALYNADMTAALTNSQLFCGEERAYDGKELLSLEMNLLRSQGYSLA